MKICFSGFSRPISIVSNGVTVFELHNRALFSRVCTSLSSELGCDALEPYTLWDDGDERLSDSGQLFIVGNPFDLPWGHRLLYGPMLAKMNTMISERDAIAHALEGHFRSLEQEIAGLALQLQSDYRFDIEWDIKRHLKTFGFKVDASNGDPLLENLIKFVLFLRDIDFSIPAVFFNLKTFLAEKELVLLYEQAVFSGIRLLLIEGIPDERILNHETKYIIDQDFLEQWPQGQSDMAVPLQEEICSNGFGAVSF